VLRIAGDDHHAEAAPLPEILMFSLRHGTVETGPNLILHAPQDPALIF
jgi:hypothetical protein